MLRLKSFFLLIFIVGTSVACSVVEGHPDSSQPLSEQLSPSQLADPLGQASSPNEPGQDQPVPELSPAPLPSSKEMTHSYENAFVRMLVTLLGLVFLVFATFWILRRLGKGKFSLSRGGRAINVIERRALSQKSTLYVVEIGNKKVLISESQLEVRALTSFENSPETNE
jgi:flagellar biogenesis protein FliO